MSKSAPVKKNKLLAGLSYLFPILGWGGLAIDVIIYYGTKNKYAKFHAGQACFLVVIIMVVVLTASMLNPITLLFHDTYSWISIVRGAIYTIYVILAIAAFAGKDFRIPIAAHLLEK